MTVKRLGIAQREGAIGSFLGARFLSTTERVPELNKNIFGKRSTRYFPKTPSFGIGSLPVVETSKSERRPHPSLCESKARYGASGASAGAGAILVLYWCWC